MTSRLLAAVLLAGCAAAPPAPPAPVTLESLLREMVDRERLARRPDPACVCAEASSYDRATVAPDKPGWYANADRSNFLRTDVVDGRSEHVLVDLHGPGAIVRVWGTWSGADGQPFANGTLRVYLDGADAPAIAGPIRDLLSGGALVGPPLSQSVPPGAAPETRGHDLYLPIPFARGCRISYETPAPIEPGAPHGEALYWSVTYRKYREGTPVESFSPAALERARPLVAEVQAALTAGCPDSAPDGDTQASHGQLAPGMTQEQVLRGPAAIRWLSVSTGASDGPQARRSTVLEITFDGERTVWCPLDAFFGTGYLGAELQGWCVRGGPSGGAAAWVMPFEREARVRLHNFGDQPVSTKLQLTTGPWRWDEDSRHFHATWHELHRVPTQTGPDPQNLGAFDARYVAVDGEGLYVGDTLSVFNGASAWWGEGDEKVYVDGESFPSHLGTGTEDYYGYAWCRPEPFSAPFHAQPCGAGNFVPGLTQVGRWRALDAIPFTRRLQFDMELWHWARTQVNWAPACFFYAAPGAQADIAPDPVAAARPVARSRDDVVDVVRVPGALEGEDMGVLSRDGGVLEVQDVAEFGWSGARQLWWRDGQVGDRLRLAVAVAAAGRYRVHARLTAARDYGRVRLTLGGVALGGELDRFHDGVTVDDIDLGVVDLPAGEAVLEVEITGANPAAEARHMFGLDCLVLERATP